MSALLTQTVEEKIELLLVAQDSSFSHQLKKKLENFKPGIEVKLKSWRQILSEKDFEIKNWFRLIFLFEQPIPTDLNQDKLENFLSFLPSKILKRSFFVYPLVSKLGFLESLSPPSGNSKQKVLSQLQKEWQNYSVVETKIFKILSKAVDPKGFIFYKNYFKPNTHPAKSIFVLGQNNLLLDLDAELNFLTRERLIKELPELIFRQKNRPILLSGKSIQSSVLVDMVRKNLDHYGLKARFKKINYNLKDSSVLADVKDKIEEHFFDTDYQKLAKEIARQGLEKFSNSGQTTKEKELNAKEGFKNSEPETSDMDNSSTPRLKPPTKEDLIEGWNKLSSNFNWTQRESILETKNEEKKDNEAFDSGSKARRNIALNITDSANESKSSSKSKMADPEKEVGSLFAEFREQQKNDHLEQLSHQTKKGLQKLKNRKALFWVGSLVTLLATGLLLMIIFFFINLSQVKNNLISYLETQRITFADQNNIAQENEQLKKLSQAIGWTQQNVGIFSGILSTAPFSQAEQIVSLSQQLVEFEQEKEELGEGLTELYLSIMSSTDNKVSVGNHQDQLIKKLEPKIMASHKASSLLRSELKSLNRDIFSESQLESIDNYEEKIVNLEKALSQLRQISPLLASLLGQSEARTYAVVMQNEQELRPTGGFIEAVALLTFNQGELINVQVENVYDLDQQLKGAVTPPPDLQRFLGEDRWYLRDSNWNPDFTETGSRIAWFIDQSLGVRVDGVLAINLEVMSQVLQVLETVELASYNEVLTSKNLVERMEYHSEVQLFNTSQEENYSQLVLENFIKELRAIEPNKIVPLLSVLREQLEEKEFLITILNPTEKGSFAALGWSGDMITPTCPSTFGDTPCLTDSLAQVEANVGVNKANHYLDRQIDHTIQLGANEVRHRRLVTFKNKAQTNAWPKGAYRAYIRFYLPSQANFEEIRIDKQPVAEDKLLFSTQAGRKVVGTLVETPIESKTELEISYVVPHSQQTPFTYVFFDQKQPGARETSPRIFLSHIPDLTPTLIAPQAEVQGEVIVFTPTNSTGHTFVGATFE